MPTPPDRTFRIHKNFSPEAVDKPKRKKFEVSPSSSDGARTLRVDADRVTTRLPGTNRELLFSVKEMHRIVVRV